MLNLKESYLLKKGILWTFSHKISPLNNYGTLRTGDIEDSDIEDTTLRTSDIEDRRRWRQATLRTGDVEDKIILKISTISKFAKLLKFSKIVKNIGYMMQTHGGWMFLLDICCQHLGKICNLRISAWGKNIFYRIYAANIWEYM